MTSTSSDSVAAVEQIVALTGMTEGDAAQLLLAGEGDVHMALHIYFESLTTTPADDSCAPPTATTTDRDAKTSIQSSAPVVRVERDTVNYDPPRVGDGALRIYAIMAWSDDRVQCRLDSGATVSDLKRAVAVSTRLPIVVQRVVFGAEALQDGDVLRAKGFSLNEVNRVAILYARRDEEGKVEVVNESGATVLTLAAEEWSFSFSVRELRARLRATMPNAIAATAAAATGNSDSPSHPDSTVATSAPSEMRRPPAAKMLTRGSRGRGGAADATTKTGGSTSFMLVYNGLSMKDYETFGMCGVHGGSRISLIMD